MSCTTPVENVPPNAINTNTTESSPCPTMVEPIVRERGGDRFVGGLQYPVRDDHVLHHSGRKRSTECDQHEHDRIESLSDDGRADRSGAEWRPFRRRSSVSSS